MAFVEQFFRYEETRSLPVSVRNHLEIKLFLQPMSLTSFSSNSKLILSTGYFVVVTHNIHLTEWYLSVEDIVYLLYTTEVFNRKYFLTS